MLVAIYIILSLQVLSIIGFALLIRQAHTRQKKLKVSMQESIKQLVQDHLELEQKIVQPQAQPDLPNLYLN
jgi:hypothetical protein